MATADSRNYDRIPLALVGVLALFLTAGAAATWLAPASDDPPPLPDLSEAQLVEVRNASGRTVLSGEFREVVDPLGNMTRDADLNRQGHHVVGEVEIRVAGPTSIAPGQELEIDLVEMESNTKYSLFIDDREVATFTTDDRGSIDMEVQAGHNAGGT